MRILVGVAHERARVLRGLVDRAMCAIASRARIVATSAHDLERTRARCLCEHFLLIALERREHTPFASVPVVRARAHDVHDVTRDARLGPCAREPIRLTAVRDRTVHLVSAERYHLYGARRIGRDADRGSDTVVA